MCTPGMAAWAHKGFSGRGVKFYTYGKLVRQEPLIRKEGGFRLKPYRISLQATFLISYLFVLLFPVIIILVFYYPYSTDIVKEKEMDWNSHITEQWMNSMDIFTRYVYNLPSELVQNREFKLYMAEESEYQRVLIANEMKKYNATDAFIDNTLLYVKSIGYLFAKTGSAYRIEDFSRPGVGYYYENWPQKDMLRELNRLTSPKVRPVENVIVPGNNRIRMLTFLLPLPIGGYDSPGAVMILVREDTIIRMMKSVSEIYTGDFFIFDGDNMPLVASNEALDGASGGIRDILLELADQPSGSGIYRIDDKPHIVSYSVSDKNGWKYVSLLPVTESLKDIRSIQRNTIILVGLVLLLEVIVIYVSMRKNYHPIKRLVDFALDLFEPADRKPGNEIETIRFALDELVTVNSKLDEKVKRALPIMRDKLLFELVSGHYRTWDDFQQEAAAYELAFDHPLATVAVLSCEAGDEDFSKVAEYCRKKEYGLPDGLQGYFFKSIYNQEMLFVGSHDPSCRLQAFLESLRQELTVRNGIPTWIGIGTPELSQTPEGVHLSYLKALRTAEHLRIRKQCSILMYNEIEVPQKGTVSYFAELLQSLELAILKNDVALVESLVERIIENIDSDGMPPHMIRSVYLNTIAVILSGLQRFRHDDRSLLRLTDAAFQHRYTIQQMVGIMRESCARLCDIIRNTLPPARAASQEEILAVIERNGFHPDFSLQMIADHFGMSLSGFSYHFKKTMGQNFKEYIDKLRIQKSIQLLKTTGETLDSISHQVGYSNTSSFIRSFKKIVGTTPGQYRDAHR